MLGSLSLMLGQNLSNPIADVTSDPSGPCTANSLKQFNTSNGKLWGCNALTWAQIGGASGVTSVFGRTGLVVAATNDYSFSQISGVLAAGQLPATAVIGGTNLTTTNGLPYINTNGSLSTDTVSTYQPCTNTTNCSNSNDGVLTVAGYTSASGGGPSNAGITIGNQSRYSLNARLFGGSAIIYSTNSGTFFLGGNTSAANGSTEINGYSGVTLNPRASQNIAAGAHIINTQNTPVLTSGGGGTGGAISASSQDASGRLTIGTTVGTGSVLITLNYAYPHASHCDATDETNSATIVAVCTFTSANQITLTGYSRTTGLAANFTASDVLSWGIPGGY